MGQRFDPDALKEDLEGSVGYAFDLASPFDDSERVGGLASSAHAFINSGIACLLVGLHEPARELFSKARTWLNVAIEKEERPARYSPNGTEALRYGDLALLNWLLDGVQDEGAFESFARYKDLYWLERRPDRTSLLLALGVNISGGLIDRAFELVRATPGLKYPQSASRMTNAAHVTFLLKQHGREGPESQQAIERFLDRSMEGWLSNGHFGQAATWAKIAYWSGVDSDVAPVEIVSRCYEHLPHREPPDAARK